MKKKFFKRLDKSSMSLLVSLPRNDVDLARAAADGGADALKIHLNVRHAASGTLFGSFEEEKARITAILDTVDIPVGVMPGADDTASAEEMSALRDMGVQFYDIYLQHLPVAYLNLKGIEGMPALGEGFERTTVAAVARWGFRLLEVSAVPHADYGKPLTMSDLALYADVCRVFPGIVVVPTQKAVRPEDIASLADAGVRALMIGKIVAGDTPDSLRRSTEAFRAAMERLS